MLWTERWASSLYDHWGKKLSWMNWIYSWNELYSSFHQTLYYWSLNRSVKSKITLLLVWSIFYSPFYAFWKSNMSRRRLFEKIFHCFLREYWHSWSIKIFSLLSIDNESIVNIDSWSCFFRMTKLNCIYMRLLHLILLKNK